MLKNGDWNLLPSLDDDQTVTPPLMATNKHPHSWVAIENDHCLIVVTSEISIDDGYGISSPPLDGDWDDLGHRHAKVFDHFYHLLMETMVWSPYNGGDQI